MDILISGIGISGPVAAYWLLKSNPNHRITLLERSEELRVSGQSIDIREAAVDVIQRMGIEQEIKANCTREGGIKFVDDDGKDIGVFRATGDVKQQGFTSEYEILRGDLVRILYDTVKDRVRTVFGDYVVELEQDERVHVTLASGEKQSYDFVLACDGQSSRIRSIILESSPREHWLSFKQIATFFTMPVPEELRGQDLAVWYNTTRGRIAFIRPDTNPDYCRANLCRQFTSSDTAGLEEYKEAMNRDELKEVFRRDFASGGWIMDKVVQGMDASTDLYASEVAQTRAPRLNVGRVALIGDSGYCPTPLTGMGTSLAIIGAYIAAGELWKSLDPSALEAYHEIMFPFARKVQNIPSSIPQYANPQTWWAIWIQRKILRFVWWSGLVPILTKLFGSPALQKKSFQLPPYDWNKQV